MKGGFKVLVNGRVEHCYQLEVDYDKGSVHFNNNESGESFDRKSFAVMTVTSEDSPDALEQDKPDLSDPAADESR